MRFAHEFMRPESTVFRTLRQRHPDTAFRSNSSMEELPPNPLEWGKRIRKLREDVKMSRAELGRRSGLAPTTIADIELGRQKGTSGLDLIAIALKTSTTYIRTGRHPSDGGAEIPEATLDEIESYIIAKFRKATPLDRARLESFVSGMSDSAKMKSGKRARAAALSDENHANMRAKRSG